MREIKFRGKRLDNKEWVYGYFSEDIQEKWYIETHEGTHMYEYEILPETRGQFTGLLSANMKGVYEGDVLQDASGRKMIVVWRDDLASFALRSEGWAYDHFFGEAIDVGYVDVIGDIYENAELIKH